MRFVDLFCGTGLASVGLRDAGLVPVFGMDSAPAALRTYNHNVARAVEADLVSALDSVRDLVINAVPDVIWMSPPPEMVRRQSRHGTWAVDCACTDALTRLLVLASEARADYVVMELPVGGVSRALLAAVTDNVPTYRLPDVHRIDAHQRAGASINRCRDIVIWPARGLRRPVPSRAPEPGGVIADVMDTRLYVETDLSQQGAKLRAAVAALLPRGGVIDRRHYDPRADRRVGMFDALEAHPDIDSDSQLLYVYRDGWRHATAHDYLRALGAPENFVLQGIKPAQIKQVCNASDTRTAALIGRSLIEVMR